MTKTCKECKKPLHDIDKCNQCGLCSACCTQFNMKKAAMNTSGKFKKQPLCEGEWEFPGSMPTQQPTKNTGLSDFDGAQGLFKGGWLD